MSDQSADIKQRIEELYRLLRIAHRNLEIYKVIAVDGRTVKYLDVLNEYLAYFHSAHHAHLVAVIVSLYGFYETRDDSHNINQLIKISGPATRQKVESDLQLAKPLWRKVIVLRNEVFGHRSSEVSIEAAFKKANLNVTSLRDLVNLTHKILNTVSYLEHSTILSLDDDIADRTLALLDKLRT